MMNTTSKKSILSRIKSWFGIRSKKNTSSIDSKNIPSIDSNKTFIPTTKSEDLANDGLDQTLLMVATAAVLENIQNPTETVSNCDNSSAAHCACSSSSMSNSDSSSSYDSSSTDSSSY